MESDWEEDLQGVIAASKDDPAVNGLKEEPDTVSVKPEPSSQPKETDRSPPMDNDGDCPMTDVVNPPPDRPAPAPPTSNPVPEVAPTQAGAPPNAPEVDGPPPSTNGTSSVAVPIPQNTSPGTRHYELQVNGNIEGPITPRNDAGPFVLDGAAGRGLPIRQRTDSGQPGETGLPSSS